MAREIMTHGKVGRQLSAFKSEAWLQLRELKPHLAGELES
jgi:hypothetical protein